MTKNINKDSASGAKAKISSDLGQGDRHRRIKKYAPVALALLFAISSAFLLYAGFYALNSSSWLAWPHLIMSSVLASAALSVVVRRLSLIDKK